LPGQPQAAGRVFIPVRGTQLPAQGLASAYHHGFRKRAKGCNRPARQDSLL